MGGSWWRVLTKRGPLGKGMANHFSILDLRTSWTAWKGKRIGHWKMNPQVSRCQNVTGEEQRNSCRRNEEAKQKQKLCPAVVVSGGEIKVQCCKEQYCTGTWNVRSMNQGKLEVVEQEMARTNTDILDGHDIYYCGQESLRRNGVALIVNKTVWNAVFGCNLKNDRIISVSKANHSISW